VVLGDFSVTRVGFQVSGCVLDVFCMDYQSFCVVLDGSRWIPDVFWMDCGWFWWFLGGFWVMLYDCRWIISGHVWL